MMLIECPIRLDRAVVEDMAGYGGWTIIAEDIEAPGPFQKWDDESAAWVEDTEALLAHERLQLARDPAALLALIEQLRQQVAGG